MGKKAQVIIIADQIAIGFAGTNLFQRPFFAHFENSGWSDEKCGTWAVERRGSKLAYSVAILLRIFELAVESFDAGFLGGFELRQVADEHDQFGFGGGGRRC